MPAEAGRGPHNGGDFASPRAQVEKTYQAPVAGIPVLTEDLVRQASSGVFALRHPDHPWSQEIRAIAAEVMA